MIDNWNALKIVLESDLEAWGEQAKEADLRFKLETDPQKQQAHQGNLALFSIHVSVLMHYLQIMEMIEKGELLEEIEELVSEKAVGGHEPQSVEEQPKDIRQEPLA